MCLVPLVDPRRLAPQSKGATPRTGIRPLHTALAGLWSRVHTCVTPVKIFQMILPSTACLVPASTYKRLRQGCQTDQLVAVGEALGYFLVCSRPCLFMSQSPVAALSLPPRFLDIFPFTRVLLYNPVCWAWPVEKLGGKSYHPPSSMHSRFDVRTFFRPVPAPQPLPLSCVHICMPRSGPLKFTLPSVSRRQP